MMKITYITDPLCRVDNAINCPPEYPARLSFVEEHLTASGLMLYFNFLTPPEVTRQQLEYVHSAQHIQRVIDHCDQQRPEVLAADVISTGDTIKAAFKAAGAAIQAVDTVMSQQQHAVFCNIRPPGHHATRTDAMGFCIFNNIAIAAAYALAAYSVGRVAIIDFDVHHGNGTEAIFEGNKQVLYCSSFQYPFYPFTDIEHYADNIVKMPLSEGARGAAFRRAYETTCFPRLEAFKPELILISAGFDAHALDPLGGLLLNESDYEWISTKIGLYAQSYCHGRIVSMLEGGYHPLGLGLSVVAHLQALLNLGSPST